MKRLASWLTLAGCFALPGACSDDKKTAALAEGCIINTDCDAPLVCAFRRCHTECTDSRDCQPGQRCVASDNPFHVCQLAEERNCTYNSDCPMNETCGVDLQCRDQCLADRDCVKTQVCVGGTCADTGELHDGVLLAPEMEAGTEVGGGGQPCLYTSECSAPWICKNQICSFECLAPPDCAPGYDCVSNRCIAGSGTLIGNEGGSVNAMGGKVTLTIPAGSLRSPVSILILAVEAWPDGALGPVFQLVPSGLEFNPPATLTYAYTADDIGTVLPESLRLANATGPNWIPLPSTMTASTVSAQLAHLSIYGLISVGGDAGAPTNATDASDARSSTSPDAGSASPTLDAAANEAAAPAL